MLFSIKRGLQLGVALVALTQGSAWAQSDPEIVSTPARDIEVAELGTVDPFEVGIQPALPETVWSSGHAGSLEAALARLPEAAGEGWASASAARLAAAALTSRGAPPRGGEADFNLAALRADRLLAASQASQVYELLARTPQVNESDALSRVFAEAAFAVGETTEACRSADALLEGREQAYWLRVRAACLAFDGAIPAAELTSELARAQTPNPDFDQFFDAFVLNRPAPENARPRTGLELTLMAMAAPGARIVPAEGAPGWLRKASERTGPSITLPQTLPEALEAAVSFEGADRAAALGALIQQDLDREIAAEALAIRLADAAESGTFIEVALAFGPEVSRLPITADTLAHGVRFVLAALVADDVNAATVWRDALMDGPPAPEPEPVEPQVYDALAPQGLTPPAEVKAVVEPEVEWAPPAPGIMVGLDFARGIALDEVRTDGFMALLAARLENATPERLCQSAALVALGADDQGQLQQALSGLTRDETVSAPAFGPLMLAAGTGALGETQVLAARLLDQHGDDAETCAASMLALDHAGLRPQALRYVLQRVIAEAA